LKEVEEKIRFTHEYSIKYKLDLYNSFVMHMNNDYYKNLCFIMES